MKGKKLNKNANHANLKEVVFDDSRKKVCLWMDRLHGFWHYMFYSVLMRQLVIMGMGIGSQ